MTDVQIQYRKNYPLRMDFLSIGVILSTVLHLYDYNMFPLVYCAFVILYSILRGPSKSANVFSRFCTKYWYVSIAFVAWVLIAILLKSSNGDALRIFSAYLLIFLGYNLCDFAGSDGVISCLKHLNVILLAGILLGFIWLALGENPTGSLSDLADRYATITVSRLTSVWMHPIPAACYIGLFIVACAYIDKGNLKVYKLIVGIVAVILTKTRSAWLALAIIAAICNLERKKSYNSGKIKRRSLWTLVSILVLCICLWAFFSNQITDLIAMIDERLFGQDLTSDMSFTWRMGSIAIIFQKAFSSNLVELLFGHGIYEGGYVLESMNFGSTYSYNVGTVDNAYMSALYDFGLVGAFLLILCFCWVLKTTLGKNTSKNTRIVSSCLLFLLIMCFFFEELYWYNISFAVFTFIGILLKMTNGEKENSAV